MAQQVTTGSNNLLDAMMQSNGSSYVDKDVATKFDAIYNKTIENKPTVDVKNTNTNQKLTNVEVVSNDSNNNSAKLLTSTEINNVGMSVNRKDVNNTKQETVDSISTESNDMSNDAENISNVSEILDEESSENEVLSENTLLKTSAQEIVQSMILLSENNLDKVETNEIVDVNEEDINIDEELTQLEDLNIDINAETFTLNTNNEISNQEVIDVNLMTISNSANVDTNINQVVEQNEVDLSNQNSAQVKVSVNIEDLKNTQVNLNSQNVNLIDQEMIDELNVTIEDVSYGAETKEDIAVFDSFEQVVKNTIEEFSSNDTDTNKIEVAENDTVEIETSVVEDGIEFDTRLVLNTKSKQLNGKVNLDDEELNVNEVGDDEAENTEIKVELNENSKKDFSENDKEQLVKPELEKVALFNEGSEASEVTFEGQVSELNTENIEVSTHLSDKNVNLINSLKDSQLSQPQLQQPKEIKTNVLNQIYNKLTSLNHTNSRVSMILNPESLGKVTLQLANSKSGITAEMIVSSNEVKGILEENLSSLKDNLLAQGVNVNNVSVKVESSENNTNMDYTEQENSDSNSQGDNKKQNGEEKNKEKFEELFSNNIEKEEQENEIN